MVLLVMAWTESTIKSWSKLKKRTTKQENNLIANVSKDGNITWYYQRQRPLSDKRIGTHPEVSLKEAKRLVTEQKASKFLGTNLDSRLTFKEYINSDSFLLQKNKERVSNKDSMDTLNNIICPVIGHVKMQDMTLQHIDKFKYGRDAMHSTINRNLNEIRAVLTHATKNKVIENNIQIKNLEERDTKNERRYLQQSEVDAIRVESRSTVDVKGKRRTLEELDTQTYLKRGHLPLIVDIALFCGMRQGEILLLKYSDIRTWDESSDEAWMFKLRAETTKSGKSRDVNLPSFLKNYLDKWWLENLSEEELADVMIDRKKKRKSIKHHNKRLFPYTTIQSSWENLKRRAELPDDISFHSLRHHFCSNALLNQVPIQIVQLMAGHSSIKTTEKYLHSIPSDSDEHIKKYWKTIYRFEEKKKVKQQPKPVMVIDSATAKLASQEIQFGTDFKFDTDEWILKNNPVINIRTKQ